jgi:peptidoglycan biosynthesis protein MviN/MurJ (putative lipid II flippase)
MWINVVVLALVAPLLLFIAPLYGAVAGGMAWLLASSLQLALGGYWLLRKKSMIKKGQTRD